jgi:hypothetical protein
MKNKSKFKILETCKEALNNLLKFINLELKFLMMIIATKLPLFKTGGEVLFASY